MMPCIVLYISLKTWRPFITLDLPPFPHRRGGQVQGAMCQEDLLLHGWLEDVIAQPWSQRQATHPRSKSYTPGGFSKVYAPWLSSI